MDPFPSRVRLPVPPALGEVHSEVGRLKSRMNGHLLAEREQVLALVSSVEGALEQLQGELAKVKRLQTSQKSWFRENLSPEAHARQSRVAVIAQSPLAPVVSAELLDAAREYDVGRCLELLQRIEESRDADLNVRDAEGRGVLHHLVKPVCAGFPGSAYGDEVRHGQLPQALRLAVRLGCDMNRQDRGGESCLWVVCSEMEMDLVAALVDEARHCGDMSLMADPNRAHGKSGRTLWHLAVEKSSNDGGGVPSSGGESEDLLYYMVLAQRHLELRCHDEVSRVAGIATSVVRSLAAGKASPGWRGARTAINSVNGHNKRKHCMPAAERDLCGPWQGLMREGDAWAWSKQTNARGNPAAWSSAGSPLHVALNGAPNEHEALRMLNVLLAQYPGTEDNDFFFTLLDPNAVDGSGQTALHLAAKNGYVGCIKALLQFAWFFGDSDKRDRRAMFDINKQDALRMTALMHAIENKHSKACLALFDHNNLEPAWCRGRARPHNLALRCALSEQTALHLACSQTVEMDDVVRVLCQNRAEVNTKDDMGFSPLHLAAMFGHIMVFKCLLKYNANPAAQENLGKSTALHIAAAFGHLNILNALLRKGGADVHAENKEGKTALHHAFKRQTLLNGLLERRLQHTPVGSEGRGIADQVERYRRMIEKRQFLATKHRAALNLCLADAFEFDQHPRSPHRDMARRMDDLELLLLAINNQNMLIKLMLDAGADLEHEDKSGDPAFQSIARSDWFDIHNDEMTEIYDHPNEMGYDSAIFLDKRTQVAVRSRWIASGQRTRALQNLLQWAVFLILLTLVATNYSGGGGYEAFGVQLGVAARFRDDEFDPVQLKDLTQVSNLEDWQNYLVGPLATSLGASTDLDSRGMLGGQLRPLGRARYRQIRTRADSCAAMPDLADLATSRGSSSSSSDSNSSSNNSNSSSEGQASLTTTGCFAGATRGTYDGPGPLEQREPITCPSGRVVPWQDSNGYLIWGQFGFYTGGGYAVEVPGNAEKAVALFQELLNCSYVDESTRVAMVEFTYYSRATQLFTHGAAYIERPGASGALVPGASFVTRRIVSYVHGSHSAGDIAVEAIWLLMVVGYFIDEAMAMTDSWGEEHIKKKNTPMAWCFSFQKHEPANEMLLENPKEFVIIMALPIGGLSLCMYKTSRSIPPYWCDVFNYVDVLIMALITALIATHVTLCVQASQAARGWADDTYVDITRLLWLASTRQHLLAITVLLSYVKSLEFLQVSAALAIPVIIIFAMLMRLLSFFLIFAVFVLAFALFDFVLYGLALRGTSSILRSIVTTFRGTMGDLDFDGKYGIDPAFGVFMTCLSAFLLVILLLNLLVAVMNEAIDEIKDSAEARWCYVQFRQIVQHQRSKEKRFIDEQTKAALTGGAKSLGATIESAAFTSMAEAAKLGAQAAEVDDGTSGGGSNNGAAAAPAPAPAPATWHPAPYKQSRVYPIRDGETQHVG